MVSGLSALGTGAGPAGFDNFGTQFRGIATNKMDDAVLEQALVKCEEAGKTLKEMFQKLNIKDAQMSNLIDAVEECVFDMNGASDNGASDKAEHKKQIRKIGNAVRKGAGLPEKGDGLPTWGIALIVCASVAVVAAAAGGAFWYFKKKQ